MASRFDLIWSEEDLETHRKEVDALIRAEEGASRARTLEAGDILPWWRGFKPLSEALAELRPYGVRTVHGGGVARAYMRRWRRAETTVGAVAWIRSGEGAFPLAVGVAVGRSFLGHWGGLGTWTRERDVGRAMPLVRRAAEAEGLEEPQRERAVGLLRFRKRALSPDWEVVKAGGVALPLPKGVGPGRTAATLARRLGLPRHLLQKALEGRAEEGALADAFRLTLMARLA